MSRVITISNSNGIVLTRPGDNPVTVASGVTLGNETASTYGIYGSGAVAWSVLNLGTLTGSNEGIVLAGGGTITNGSAGHTGAVIAGEAYGALIEGRGRVVNAASIRAGYTYSLTNGSATRTASLGTAIKITDGGTLINAAGPHAVVSGASAGVVIGMVPGVVVNGGTIIGSAAYTDNYFSQDAFMSGQTGVGISLQEGGSVTNGSAGNLNAVIEGGSVGIEVAGAPGSVSNFATIQADNVTFYYNFDGISTDTGTAISLASGGSVTNGLSGASSALVKGGTYGVAISGEAGQVTNLGTIQNTGYALYVGRIGYYRTYYEGAGVTLGAGGTVVNGSSAAATGAAILSGNLGLVVSGQSGWIYNYGTVAATNISGSYGYRYGTGVELEAGGRVINGSTLVAGALIEGGAVGVQIVNAFGTVGNDGTIIGARPIEQYLAGGIGVLMSAGGKVNNGLFGVKTALISGPQYGISISGGSGTVINSGTIVGRVGVSFGTDVLSATVVNNAVIEGTGGVAVAFGAGADTLEVASGAVFDGVVSASGSAGCVIELLAGTEVAPPGIIGGIGTEFTGFSNLQLAVGANWSLTGANGGGRFGVQLHGGSHLGVAGTLAIGSVLDLAGPGTLSVGQAGRVVVGGAGTGAAGLVTIDAASGAKARGSLVGTGTIASGVADNGVIVVAGGTLDLAGNAGGSGFISISAHSVLEAGKKLSTSHVTFLAGGSATLALAAPSEVSSVLSGFAAGDKIDLIGTVATSLSFSSSTHVLTVRGAHGAIAALHFAGAYAGHQFHLGSDGHGGSTITLS